MMARRSSSDMFGIGGAVLFCDAMSCSTDCILIKGCPTNDPSVLDSSARPRSDRAREFANNTNALSSNSKLPSTSEPSPSVEMKACDFSANFCLPKVLAGFSGLIQFQNVAFS